LGWPIPGLAAIDAKVKTIASAEMAKRTVPHRNLFFLTGI